MTLVVLASTSRYRQELLRRLTIPFRCVPPLADEEALKQRLGPVEPEELVRTLARAKAESVLPQEPTAVVIGSDQVVALEGIVLGKPGTRKAAMDQLLMLQGKTHSLCTAVVLVRAASTVSHVDVTRLHMRRLTRDQIERYVDLDNPVDCAGAYKLEQHGIALFERIESDDHSAITGLPLVRLATMLISFGIPIP